MYDPPYTKRSMNVIHDLVDEMTEARELALEERNFNFSIREEADKFETKRHRRFGGERIYCGLRLG